jgi:hypothetical protein
LNDTHPEVVIRAEVKKTREARFVDLSENACAWSQAYLKTRHSPPAPNTLVVPFSFDILRKPHLRKLLLRQIPKRGQSPKATRTWFNRDASKVLQTSCFQKRSGKVLVNLPTEQEEQKVIAFPAV